MDLCPEAGHHLLELFLRGLNILCKGKVVNNIIELPPQVTILIDITKYMLYQHLLLLRQDTKPYLHLQVLMEG